MIFIWPTRSENVEAAELAKLNGCKVVPRNFDDVFDWNCCGCADNLHHGDQQCSIITMKSARRGKRRVLLDLPPASKAKVERQLRQEEVKPRVFPFKVWDDPLPVKRAKRRDA